MFKLSKNFISSSSTRYQSCKRNISSLLINSSKWTKLSRKKGLILLQRKSPDLGNNFVHEKSTDNKNLNVSLNSDTKSKSKLIDETSLPENLAKGIYYHEKIIIGYSRQQMCDLVYNVAEYKEFVPFCVDSVILSDGASKINHLNLRLMDKKATENSLVLKDDTKTQSAKNFKARLEIGFPPIKESYVSHVSMVRPHFVKAISRDTNLFEFLINEWKFYPHPVNTNIKNTNTIATSNFNHKSDEEKCCLLEFYVSFKFRNPIYSGFSTLFMDQIFKKMVTAFISRAQELYGKPHSISDK